MTGRSPKFCVVYIYYSIIISSVLYACYRGTDNFMWRIASFPFVLVFYGLSFWYLRERWLLVKSLFRKTDFKYLYLFLILELFILLFSISSGLNDLITLFFHPYAFLAFFIAFVSITINSKKEFIALKKMCDRISSLFIIFILIDLLVFKQPVLINELYLFLIFSLIFSTKGKLLWKGYLISLLILVMITNALLINRTIAIRIALTLIGLGTLFLIKFTKYKLIKGAILVFSVIFLFEITFRFDEIFSFIVNSKIFSSINETDTRSFLFTEFFHDLKGNALIWGRGYLGKYDSLYFATWQGPGGDAEHRFTVEVGILNLLLKGGYILLLFYLSVLLLALKKGLFDLYNYGISAKISIFLLVQFLILGIENNAAFNANNFSIWLSVGILFYMHEMKKRKGKIYEEKRQSQNLHYHSLF